MKFKVGLHASDEGFAVSVPGLSGCLSQGRTESEALENVKKAIEEYLAAASRESVHSGQILRFRQPRIFSRLLPR